MAEFASIDQDVLDAMGEVTNMIIGNFKNLMEEVMGLTGMSIPVVIFGTISPRAASTRLTGWWSRSNSIRGKWT